MTKMTLSQVREMYPEAPGYSDEVGRFVGKNGATYRAWLGGMAQAIDHDANDRLYGDESKETFSWK